jgi:hypothetical protein
MATIPIPNAPTYLSMNDFRAINDKYGSLAKSCKFIARVRPSGQYLLPYINFTQDLTYLCEVGELPGRGFMNLDVRYYGPNQKLPFQSTYEDISLNFLCRTQSLERQFFDDWMLIINPINSFDFNYRDDYTSMIDLYQYSEDYNGPMYWITLHNAYPLLVNPQPMTWADDQFQRLVVSFTYTHWSRPGLDPLPRFGNSQDGRSFELVEGRINNRNT